jgi:hypothetical protein
MAIRLTVIMIESVAPPAAGAGSNQLIEQVVGNLLGRPGIDLVLIRSLAGLDPNSTDGLTLESIAGDVAVLDWQPPEEIVSALQRIGFNGCRAPHRFDTSAAVAAADERRIYAFDLTRIRDVAELQSALEALKSDRQVRTFSIGTLAPPRRPAASQAPRPAVPAAEPASVPVSVPASSVPASSVPASSVPASFVPAAVCRQTELDLDALIDQLDRSDQRSD